MKKAIKRLKAFDAEEHCLNAIIETPKGSRVKYSFSPKTGLFELKKALPEGMSFPFNFGFIPSTKGDDGDPLDILILNEEPLLPGCLVKVRLAGAMKAEQREDGKTMRNDRLLGFAIGKQTPTSLESVKLDDKTMRELDYFFKSYNKLEGKKFKVLGQATPKQALQMVKKGEKNHAKEQESDSE
ncbi:MAG TPA: inorganic diphosphatase [Verrucomicrobiae bacterium]|nr:inorganic diphosphatase [Verrucomicrobiae bacterium]